MYWLMQPIGRSGYRSGENYQAPEQRGIVDFVPPRGKYQADRQVFACDAAIATGVNSLKRWRLTA